MGLTFSLSENAVTFNNKAKVTKTGKKVWNSMGIININIFIIKAKF